MRDENIELRNLRHIVALSRLLSYTKAAEELGMTQSALSRSIQSFESKLGVRLFDRDRSGVHMTSVGREFTAQAVGVLQDFQNLERMLKRTAGAEAGKISYGIAPLPARALLPLVTLSVLTESAALECQVLVRKAESLMPLLIAEEIEFFICAEGQIQEPSPTKSVALGWFPVSLLVRARHPVLGGDTSAPQRYPLILADRAREETLAKLSRRFSLSGPQHLIEDYATAARVTANSDAIWLSSRYAAADEIREGRLVEVPLSAEKPRFRMMMYNLNRRTLSPAAIRLKARYEHHLRQLAQAG